METVAENPNNIPHKRAAQTIPASSSTTSSPSRNPKSLTPKHLDSQHVSASARIFCEVLDEGRSDDVESALSATGIIPTLEVVEEVLKLSYNSPSSAISFFRWAGRAHKPSAYAWNLMVDILGKNESFEVMWDAIRSMKQESMLSVATFSSVFGSYCRASKYDEAIMSFDVMNMYGVEQDVVAVNSLLSAICREDNQTMKALEFLNRVRDNIPPDGDSFAILLEGWEKEGNVVEAKRTFGEMVDSLGWNPEHRLAYDAFLTTLVHGGLTKEAMKFLKVMKSEKCFPGLKFFSNTLDILAKQNDPTHAVLLWDIMVAGGVLPNLIMYNAFIGLLCDNNDLDNAFRFLDEMVLNGAFPDSLTYNMIFQCLIKNKKVCQVEKFFYEMVKNEWPPTHLNCAGAISMLLEGDDPETAIEIWNYMLENRILPLEVSANALLIGLRNMGRLLEVRRFAEDMIDRRIIIYEVTMQKLKNAFFKESRSMRDKYDSLEKIWKKFRR